MSVQTAVSVEAVVEEVLPKGLFALRTEDGRRIVATLSPDAKRVLVRLLPSDGVRVVPSVYDPTRGRIIGRLE